MNGDYSNSWFYIVFNCYIFLFQCIKWVMIETWILAIWITTRVVEKFFSSV